MSEAFTLDDAGTLRLADKPTPEGLVVYIHQKISPDVPHNVANT